MPHASSTCSCVSTHKAFSTTTVAANVLVLFGQLARIFWESMLCRHLNKSYSRQNVSIPETFELCRFKLLLAGLQLLSANINFKKHSCSCLHKNFLFDIASGERQKRKKMKLKRVRGKMLKIGKQLGFQTRVLEKFWSQKWL